jgi:hypothetical protein
VTGNDMGSWSLCCEVTCEVGASLIEMDTVDGEGRTGYLTIKSSAKYVRPSYLTLTRCAAAQQQPDRRTQ